MNETGKHILAAALEAIDEAVAIYDSDDRLIFFNENYAELRAAIGGDVHRGVRWDELVTASVESGHIPEASGQEEEWLRFRRQARGSYTIKRQVPDGRWYQVNERRMPNGGIAVVWTEISELVRAQQELREIATRDGLTGLYHRGQFATLAEFEWERARRYGRPLSMLMLDIDLFKSVNDRYGHDVGDRVITHVAGLCRDMARATDIVARLGGEEFGLLLPETDCASACALAERLRQAAAENHILIDGAPIEATISIGACEAGELIDFSALAKAADMALYQAKRSGRNRVCSFEAHQSST